MLRHLLPLALVLALFHTASADDVKRVTLDGKPGVPAPAQEDGKDGIHRIKKVDPASLEIYAAKQKPSKGTVIVAPGGGYSILAVNHEGRDVAKLLNEAGWDAAVLLYHVSEGPQTRDLAIADAKAALSLVQKRGAELGLSTERVGFMGFSAGGHLAARLGTEAAAAGNPASFLILIYPAYLQKDGQILPEVAPPSTPIFLYVAEDDKLAPSSAIYAKVCQEKGIRCDYTSAPSGGHGFGLKDPLPQGVREWPDKLRAFLSSVAK